MRKRVPEKILVTGGAGFIGSEFVRQAVGENFLPIVVDRLTYAADMKRLDAVRGRFKFYQTDIASKSAVEAVFKNEQPCCVVHFAAESHVDRSISDVAPFIRANILGTEVLLEAARRHGVRRVIHISTDEVYGEIAEGRFTEESALAPNSPYAATKASADLLVKAYVRTYGFPAIIVRPCNNYGPWQYPEKLIPVVIIKALSGHPVPVYAKGQNVREWLHVSDCVAAVLAVLKKGVAGEVYNIGSGFERKNIDTVRAILRALGKPEKLIEFVRDRPGHDFRYALDFSKVKKLGWRPRIAPEEGFRSTVAWYCEHRAWFEAKRARLESYWKKVYKVDKG